MALFNSIIAENRRGEIMAKKQSKKVYKVVYTRSQKIKGWLALIMLFVCGVMVGMGIGYNTEKPKQALVQDATELQQNQQKETCAIIEEIQLGYLNDENSSNIEYHKDNIRIYETLFQHGCPQNKGVYRAAISREMEIVAALGGQNDAQTTCQKIEASLLDKLPEEYTSMPPYQRITRAKIYANLSERGCDENKAKYVELAKQELEIARALQDDEFNNEETIEVVETYKRLNMQAAAEEIFETAKKLTNPAIDFILEVEKIINEH